MPRLSLNDQALLGGRVPPLPPSAPSRGGSGGSNIGGATKESQVMEVLQVVMKGKKQTGGGGKEQAIKKSRTSDGVEEKEEMMTSIDFPTIPVNNVVTFTSFIGPELVHLIQKATTTNTVFPPPSTIAIQTRLHHTQIHGQNIMVVPIVPPGRRDEDEIIVIDVPGTLVSPTDRQWFRYEVIRAQYALHLYQALLQRGNMHVSIVPPPYDDGTNLRDILVETPSNNTSRIYITVSLPASAPFTKLKPHTPYGTRLLTIMRQMDHLHFLSSASLLCPSFASACAFISRWLCRDSMYNQEPGRLTAHTLHMVLAQLVTGNDEQLLRTATAETLCKRIMHWIQKLSTTTTTTITVPDTPFTPSLNLAANATLSSLRYLAHRATQYLARHVHGTSVWHDFDKFISIPAPSPPPPSHQPTTSETASMNTAAIPWSHTIIHTLESLLVRGLSNRVTMFRVSLAYNDNTNNTFPSHIIVGLAIDTSTAYRIIERGPPPEQTDDATAFRKLWGTRAELRQFKDGSIIESVVFDESARKRIPELIVEHLVRTHEPFMGAFTDATITVRSISHHLDRLAGHDDEFSTRVLVKEFHALQTALTSQHGGGSGLLPLGVLSVRANCACLRGTSLDVPSPHPMLIDSLVVRNKVMQQHGSATTAHVDRRVHACELSLEFESSSKWPDRGSQARIVAKRALLMAVGSQLCDGKLIKHCFVDGESLLVTMPEGYAFRIVVALDGDKEPQCKLHANLNSLGAKAYSFPLVARLAKRWVSGHLLSGAMDDFLVDLLVASLFVRANGKENIPKGALSGLLRFLHLVHTWRWHDEPLVVDVNDEVSSKEEWNEVNKMAQRTWQIDKEAGKGLAMSVMVAQDGGTFYGCKSLHTLNRAVDLAGKSIVLLEGLCRRGNGNGDEEDDAILWQALFSSSVTRQGFFNVVLHLDESQLVMESSTKFKNLLPTGQAIIHRALLGFDPLREFLKNVHEEGLDRFCDLYYGAGRERPCMIGIVWHVDNVASPFSVVRSAHAQVVAGHEIKVDVRQVLEELVKIGRGLICKVEMLND